MEMTSPKIERERRKFVTRLRLRNFIIAAFPSFADRWELYATAQMLAKYRSTGLQLPLPPLLKRMIILREALRIQASMLVETGTFLGDTAWAFRNQFQKIVTIELQPALAEVAQARFARFPRIHVLIGDSGDILPDVVREISTPAVFWLDGHYSGGSTGRGNLECPILAELAAIADAPSRDHSLLIDDARLFGVDKDYPPIEEVRNFVRQSHPNHQFSVETDVVHIRRS